MAKKQDCTCTPHNETGCRNAGKPRTPALTLPAGARGQEKRQQVIPAHAATGPTLCANKKKAFNLTYSNNLKYYLWQQKCTF